MEILSAEALAGLLTLESLVALLTLATLEIVLGIDNVIFIAILTDKLPEQQRAFARNLGLALAAAMRVGLLFAIAWIMGMTATLFTVPWLEHEVSGKDLVLLGGGIFLIAKATWEIHEKLEGPEEHGGSAGRRAAASFGATIAQILALDMVFSLDSIITAVGMVPPDKLLVMIVAILIAVAVMIAFAGPVSRFVQRRPTMKMLALAFLVLIGVMLVAEGTHQHISKGYIYFAMAFSFIVELLNQRLRKVSEPVQLRGKGAGVAGG